MKLGIVELKRDPSQFQKGCTQQKKKSLRHFEELRMLQIQNQFKIGQNQSLNTFYVFPVPAHGQTSKQTI